MDLLFLARVYNWSKVQIRISLVSPKKLHGKENYKMLEKLGKKQMKQNKHLKN